MSKRIVALALLVSVCVFAHGAHAADPTPKPKPVDLDDLSGHLDLSIPQSPAFTLLGVTPEAVVQSDDFRTVATGLLKGLDAHGNMQEGIALDVRPYLIAFGEQSTLADYRAHYWVQVLSRTQFSFATASGSDDSDRADRQAFGLNLKLWMQDDPAVGQGRLEYTDAKGVEVAVPREKGDMTDEEFALAKRKATIDGCYKSYLIKANPVPDVLVDVDNAGDKTAAEDLLASGAREVISECLDKFKEQHWNAGSINLAIASHRSKVGTIDENGYAAWLGASYGIGKRSQFIARLSYSDDLLVPVKDQAGQYDVVDERAAGLRLRYGSARGAFTVEGLWTRSRSAAADEKYWRGSVGAELMIMRDVWVQLAVGKAFGTNRFDDDPVYSGQLRFGFTDKSLFAK